MAMMSGITGGSATPTPDATAATKGKLALTGQLGGTADSPAVTGLTESGSAALAMGAVADGQFLRRSSTSMVGQDLYAPLPDYTPPSFTYKDADEIYLPAGRYYKAGYRHRGQYQSLINIDDAYWEINSRTIVDIDGSYSEGVSSGILGGKINSSWYSVFLLGNDANSLMLLPFIRIKAIAYSAPSTIINPGDHATGGSNENGFLTVNDQWNTYRLIKLSSDVYDGTIYTIADCATATPDTISITGDKTGELSALNWLQLVPPSGTACLYLGAIKLDASGNLTEFSRTRWSYIYKTPLVATVSSATTGTNLDLGSFCPPSATEIAVSARVDTYTDGGWATIDILYGSANENIISRTMGGASGNYCCASLTGFVPITETGWLRYRLCNQVNGILYGVLAQANKSLSVNGFRE